jgi:hypothetical protein
MSLIKYAALDKVLQGAYDQASTGKGKERHADDEPFENQKICVINRWLSGSPVAGALFQAVKKTVESSRLSGERAINELRGAINYLAAAIILLEEKTPPESEEEPLDGIAHALANPLKMGNRLHHRLFQDEDVEEVSEVWSNPAWYPLRRMRWQVQGVERRLCAMCEFGNLLISDVPCKKCFYLPFKPHWKPQG